MAKPSVQKKSPADRKWKRPPGSPVKEDQVSPEDFARIWYECDCSASVMAERTGLGLRNIYKRRERLSADGFSLPGPGVNQGMLPSKWTYPREIHVNIESGTVLVGNDAHIWPETHCPIPPIRKVFAQIGKSLKVDYTILNGDLVDGTRISRWPRLRGQNTPKFLEELQAAQRFCLALSGHRIFVLGNHDTRLDSYLSNRAEEVEDMLPSLRDYLEGWDIGYSVVINDDVEVRHNFRGGIHTGYNNTLQAGRTMITGHTHQLQIRSWADRRGIRWGVEGGMLADPNGPQFEWQLGMPNRWQAGFIVLTFAEGRLLPPEKAEVLDGKVVFRGKRYG